MENNTTHTIELIVNEMIIYFGGEDQAYRKIKVSQYKMNEHGVYFLYNNIFRIGHETLYDPPVQGKERLFFVPFEHIKGIEIAVKDKQEDSVPATTPSPEG